MSSSWEIPITMSTLRVSKPLYSLQAPLGHEGRDLGDELVLIHDTGMGVTMKDVVWPWRRSILQGKSVLALYAVAPAITVVIMVHARELGVGRLGPS
jgi:hypothetical protein